MSNLVKNCLRPIVPASLWTALRRWRGSRELAQFRARVVTHVYHGKQLRITLRDGLAESWYDHDWSEQPEITFLQSHRLNAGARVFDCGAHQAVVAMVLASIVGSTGRVIAVEALSHNVAVAEENLRLNPSLGATLHIVRAAIADRSGTVEFSEDFSRNGQLHNDVHVHSGKQSVPSVTLDELAERFGPPDVVFLDIEGAEQLALRGASRLLAAPSKPDWFIEVHVGTGLEILGGSVEAICSALVDADYRLFWCDPEIGTFQALHPSYPSRRFYLCAVTSQR